MTTQDHQGTGHNINANNVNIVNDIPRHLSLLSDIINELGNRLDENQQYDDKYIAFHIQEKISYNQVQRYNPIIEELKIHVGELSAIYNEFDRAGRDHSQRVLRNIKLHYLDAKGKFVSGDGTDINQIRINADNILNYIEERLTSEILNSNNIQASREDINVCVKIVIVDAFMRCKILEPPIDVIA